MSKLKPYMKQGIIETGVDEVGRGCLAGNVVAASVILPEDFDFEIVKDSKQLKEHERKEAFEIIKDNAIAYGIGWVSAKRIDEINILNATFEAMHIAINRMEQKITKQVNHLLIDGNRFKSYQGIPHTCVVKGDATYYSIAAASILAKVVRDEYMKKLSSEFPGYGWETNMGYGSKKHRDAIKEIGINEQHRISFLGNILPKNNLF
jgi:ribonuclease HII